LGVPKFIIQIEKHFNIESWRFYLIKAYHKEFINGLLESLEVHMTFKTMRDSNIWINIFEKEHITN